MSERLILVDRECRLKPWRGDIRHAVRLLPPEGFNWV